MSIAEGTYLISKDNFHSLMLPEGAENAPAYILPGHPSNCKPEFQWKLTKCSNGNYHIRNEGFENDTVYLAPVEKDMNAPLVGKREAFEWRMQPAGDNKYHIVVPGGPINGVELAADASLLHIFPPRTALRPLDVHNREQTWLMTKLKD